LDVVETGEAVLLDVLKAWKMDKGVRKVSKERGKKGEREGCNVC